MKITENNNPEKILIELIMLEIISLSQNNRNNININDINNGKKRWNIVDMKTLRLILISEKPSFNNSHKLYLKNITYLYLISSLI